MTTTTEPILVDSTIAPQLKQWFDAGRGVRRWVSAEIGTQKPDVYTPGDVTANPHWAYLLPDSQLVEASQLSVETFTPRTTYRAQLKRNYWGYSLRSEAKANRLCNPGESWRWEHIGYGMATVTIGAMVVTSFTDWSASQC